MEEKINKNINERVDRFVRASSSSSSKNNNYNTYKNVPPTDDAVAYDLKEYEKEKNLFDNDDDTNFSSLIQKKKQKQIKKSIIRRLCSPWLLVLPFLSLAFIAIAIIIAPHRVPIGNPSIHKVEDVKSKSSSSSHYLSSSSSTSSSSMSSSTSSSPDANNKNDNNDDGLDVHSSLYLNIEKGIMEVNITGTLSTITTSVTLGLANIVAVIKYFYPMETKKPFLLNPNVEGYLLNLKANETFELKADYKTKIISKDTSDPLETNGVFLSILQDCEKFGKTLFVAQVSLCRLNIFFCGLFVNGFVPLEVQCPQLQIKSLSIIKQK